MSIELAGSGTYDEISQHTVQVTELVKPTYVGNIACCDKWLARHEIKRMNFVLDAFGESSITTAKIRDHCFGMFSTLPQITQFLSPRFLQKSVNVLDIVNECI